MIALVWVAVFVLLVWLMFTAYAAGHGVGYSRGMSRAIIAFRRVEKEIERGEW